MPNWCSNEVVITGDTATISKIAEIAQKNPEGFQMEDFVPMPEELRNTTAPQDTLNWYDWSVSNWGTKWDMCDVYSSFSEGSISISCNTAWAPNVEFWAKFSELYPQLVIEHRYLEEGMCFIGEATYEAGDYSDTCLDITGEMYKKAGAILDEENNIDWDNPENYDIDLWSLFPLQLTQDKEKENA
jgi:hypothetical protein